jgi:hypothetical protein
VTFTVSISVRSQISLDVWSAWRPLEAVAHVWAWRLAMHGSCWCRTILTAMAEAMILVIKSSSATYGNTQHRRSERLCKHGTTILTVVPVLGRAL